MPSYLLKRTMPDSVKEFRVAARERYLDGSAAAEAGRRTAAIYLWGYAAEMTLKAAYFSSVGFAWTSPITVNDLKSARNAAIHIYGIFWLGISTISKPGPIYWWSIEPERLVNPMPTLISATRSSGEVAGSSHSGTRL